MLRLVMLIAMQVKPLVQRWGDFRRTEHEHQCHSDRADEHTKVRCGNFRVGGAGDHVRRWNVVTIPNASSRPMSHIGALANELPTSEM